jgi:hypothetical protein
VAITLAIASTGENRQDGRYLRPYERISPKNSVSKLVRYRVLDIAPMRDVLDHEGEARSKGLRHALHICRGHFKTFTDEAPLFGKHTGQYWWPQHVRGHAGEGMVIKGYAVELGRGSSTHTEDPPPAASQSRDAPAGCLLYRAQSSASCVGVGPPVACRRGAQLRPCARDRLLKLATIGSSQSAFHSGWPRSASV